MSRIFSSAALLASLLPPALLAAQAPSLSLGEAVGQALRVGDEARLAAARVDVAEAQVTLDVIRLYLRALLAERLVQIHEAGLAQAEGHLTQVEQLERAGRAARFDVLRARVDRANLEPLLIQARSDRELALLELKRLVNLPIEQALSLSTTLDPTLVDSVAGRVEADSSPGSDRPSVRAAEFVARARDAVVNVARAEYLPSISVFLQTGFQAFPQEGGFPTERGRILNVECPPGSATNRSCVAHNGGWFSDRLLGINVSWPLLTGFRTRANADVAQTEARIADLQVAQAREAATLEAAAARADLRRARATFAAQRQNSTEAEEAFRLAALRFNKGLSTQLDVSAAQLALLTAQTNEARAVHDLYVSTAALARALGLAIPLPDGTLAPNERE